MNGTRKETMRGQRENATVAWPVVARCGGGMMAWCQLLECCATFTRWLTPTSLPSRQLLAWRPRVRDLIGANNQTDSHRSLFFVIQVYCSFNQFDAEAVPPYRFCSAEFDSAPLHIAGYSLANFIAENKNDFDLCASITEPLQRKTINYWFRLSSKQK